MKLRRALLFIAVLSLLSALAIPAQARTDDPYWQVETNIPVETIQGGWTVAENGLSARLEFDGVNVVGQATSFKAGWTTPWVKRSHADGGELLYLIGPETQGSLRTEVRTQTKGHHWGPWFGGKMPFTGDAGGWYWDSASFGFDNELVRYQWRMTGAISGAGYLEGAAEVSVD